MAYDEQIKKQQLMKDFDGDVTTYGTFIGGNNKMENTTNKLRIGDTFSSVISMKMLKSVMKDKDADLGKLFLMQQMSSGGPIQVSDVIKSKLISEFNLNDDKDNLPVEKLLLLQMLESGSGIDITQIILFKMMSGMFDDDSKE